MNIADKNIDGGKAFDWGKTSEDYAKFRDIYPQEFYDKIVNRQLCINGQNVLDVGTGTGVLPRNMYRDHQQIRDKFFRMLKPGGRILVLYMAWLPFEDEIAGESERLVLKYSPKWSGAGETIHPIDIPDCYKEKFELVYHEEYPLEVHFTRESWNGRMKACRGIGASLTKREIAAWEREHKKLLAEIAPAEFHILHYGAVAELKVIK